MSPPAPDVPEQIRQIASKEKSLTPNEGRRRPVAGGALHDHDQHLGMHARVIGAEQSVDLLLCRLQSLEHHVDIVGQ